MLFKIKPILALSILIPCTAFALPFNQDMVGGQMVTGTIMRPKAPHSVPYGSLAERQDSKDTSAKLDNPLKGNAASTLNGERLFAVNCSVCHGVYGGGKQVAKAVEKIAAMGAPDLTSDMYKTQRTDGQIFAVIHYGGMAIMPGYGWKLSSNEKWDIVNYVRKIQGVR